MAVPTATAWPFAECRPQMDSAASAATDASLMRWIVCRDGPVAFAMTLIANVQVIVAKPVQPTRDRRVA
jgi:hypothetical protein